MALMDALMRWSLDSSGLPPPRGSIVISTLDNPGWHVHVWMPTPRKDAILVRREGSESWLDIRFRGGDFDGSGGAHDLEELLRIFLQQVGITSTGFFENEPLTRLQEWYASRCDGEWEHDGGARLSTDGSGWDLELHLYEEYWQEPAHHPPALTVLSSSYERVRVSGPTASIEKFIDSLRSVTHRGG